MKQPRSNRKLVAVTCGMAAAILVVLCTLVYGTRRQQRTAASKHEEAAQAAIQKGDPDKAEVEWLAAIADWPDDANAYSNLGDLYRFEAQPETAAACYQRLLHVSPDFHHIYCRLAAAARDANAHLEAYQDAQHELKLDPDCPTALDILSVYDGRKGDDSKAKAEAKHAYQTAPGDELAVTTYAKTFLPDEPDKAAAVLVGGQQRLPNSWEVAYLLGWCYAHSTSDSTASEKALSELRKAKLLNPEVGDVHREMSRLLLLRNQVTDAVREGELAVHLNPYQPESYLQYYQGLERAGDHTSAQKVMARLRFLQTVLDRQKGLLAPYQTSHFDPQITHQLAQTYEQLGDLHRSLAVTRAALSTHPTDNQLQQDFRRLLIAGAR